jgi:hypothetical protein
MKKRLCYFILLLALTIPVFSQEAYKGQIFITKQQFIRKGNMLIFKVSIFLPTNLLLLPLFLNLPGSK